MANGGGLTKGDILGEGQIVITASMDESAKRAISDFMNGLNQIVKGSKVANYLDTIESASSRLAASFARFKKERNDFNARSFINDFNGLEGIAKSEGKEFESLFKGISGGYSAIKSAITDAQSIARGTSFDGVASDTVQSFRNAGKVMREWGVDVSGIIQEVASNASMDDLRARINDLNEALAVSNSERDRAAKSAKEFEQALERANASTDRWREKYNEAFYSDDYQKLKDDAESYQDVLRQNTAEVKNFLQQANLASFDRWGDISESVDTMRISEILKLTESGSLSARDAIVQLKSEFGNLIDISSADIGESRLNSMEAAVRETLSVVNELKGAAGAGSGMAMAGGQTILDRTIGDSEQLAGDTAAMQTATQVVVDLLNSLVSAGGQASGAQSAIKGIVDSLGALAAIDVSNLTMTSDIFRQLPKMANIDVKDDQIDGLVRALQKLSQLSKDVDLSALTTLTNIRLDGFSNLSVSKASMSNLATYLPQIASADIGKLRELATINLHGFDNLKVGVASVRNIAGVLAELNKFAGGSDAAPASFAQIDDSIAEKAQNVAKAVQSEKEAMQAGNQAAEQHVSAFAAAAQAEKEKAEASEKLMSSLKQEEKATKASGDSANEHAKDVQRMLKLQRDMATLESQQSKAKFEDPNRYAEITKQLAEAKKEYASLYANNEGKFSDADLRRLGEAAQDAANKVRLANETMRDSAQKTADANAKATRAQIDREKKAAEAATEAARQKAQKSLVQEQNEQVRAAKEYETCLRRVNTLLSQGSQAEQKYALAKNAPGLRDYYS